MSHHVGALNLGSPDESSLIVHDYNMNTSCICILALAGANVMISTKISHGVVNSITIMKS